jgi:hypothetical protein
VLSVPAFRGVDYVSRHFVSIHRVEAPRPFLPRELCQRHGVAATIGRCNGFEMAACTPHHRPRRRGGGALLPLRALWRRQMNRAMGAARQR